MLEPNSQPGGRRPSPAACDHDYALDAELEMWVCKRCGSALELQTQSIRHECGPDCDRHGDISAIG